MKYEQLIYLEKNKLKNILISSNNPNKKTITIKHKIKYLYELYEELYERQNISLLDNREVIVIGNIIAYPQERQAEPLCIINLTINDIDKRIQKMEEILN